MAHRSRRRTLRHTLGALRPAPSAAAQPGGAAVGAEPTASKERWAPAGLVTHDRGSGLDAEGADSLSLTPAEIEQFKERGYIIKRGLIPAETLAPFIERIWSSLPPPLSRHDATSWLNAGEKWDSGGEQGSGWGGATTPEGLPTTRAYPVPNGSICLATQSSHSTV